MLILQWCSALLLFLARQVYAADPFQDLFVGSNCQRCLCEDDLSCGEDLTTAYQPETKSAGGSPTTEFYLYTRRNANRPECLHKHGGRLPQNSNFVPDAILHVIFLTFTDGLCTYAYSRELRDEILKRCDCNVLIVDWRWGGTLDLAGAMINTYVVAEQSVFVLRNIMSQTGITPSKFHFMGWSLAAHLAGLTGKRIKGVYRITGLDPAGSAYIDRGPEDKLMKDDAEIVDVIHTNGGDCVVYAFGYPSQEGDADFIVNGGKQQYNCEPMTPFHAFVKQDYKFAVITSPPMICSHSMSIMYFKASINPHGCQFIGCTNPVDGFLKKVDPSECVIMGYDYPLTHRNDGRNRTYYVTTDYHCPYCNKRKYDMYIKATGRTKQGITAPLTRWG